MNSKSNNQFRKFLYGIILVGLLLSLCLGMNGSPATHAQEAATPGQNDYYTVNTVTLSDGTVIEEDIINGPPVPPPGFEIERQAVSLPKPDNSAGINILAVPAYDWVFGCSAVSGAMIAAYYDRNGYQNIYTGPTNGGVMPVDNSSWPTWSDGTTTYPSLPLAASKNGVDGRTTRGSIDDYWVQYDNNASDPYRKGGWTQHTWGDAIGDYMKTSQSFFGNPDGTTHFYIFATDSTRLTCDDMVSAGVSERDGTYGRKLFYEAKGYTVTDCYNQKTDNNGGGFTFALYKAEIDAGQPVLLNLTLHSVVGVGYDDTSNTVYIHDTWDYSDHTMTWGGSYSGMALAYVSIVNLIPLDIIAPVGSVVIAGGALYTVSTNVNLTLGATDATSGVAQMSFSNDGSSWSAWESYATSKAWILNSGDGNKTVYVRYQDNAGNISNVVTDTITLDTVVPTGSVVIANGATYTASTNVNLTLTTTDATSGVAQMSFSNDGNSWSAWESYITSKAWILSSGDGSKTVYARYQDNAGNISDVVTDTITLDTVVPTGSVVIDGGSTYTASTSVSLTLNANDATSGVGQMSFSNDGNTWSAWQAYANSTSWTLATGDGSKTVYTRFKDAAGNVSENAIDTIILDTVIPTGSVVIEGGATYTASTNVNLTLSASDAKSSIAKMSFSNNGSSWSAWECYITSKAWILSSGDGSKTVYARYQDNAGNISDMVTDTITLDTVKPSGSVVINGGATYAALTNVNLTISANDSTSGVGQMSFSNDGGNWSVWQAYANSTNWIIATGDGSKIVYARFKDNAGNVSANATDTITLDTTPPTITSIIRANPDPTNATNVDFTVTFSEAVTGADAGDFILTKTGAIIGESVTGVSGGPIIYTVGVNTGIRNGNLRLDVPASAAISDLVGNLLANLPYTSGETYTITKVFSVFLPLILR